MEDVTLEEYQQALRNLLLWVMRQPGLHGATPREGSCRVVWSLPTLIEIVSEIPNDPGAVDQAIRRRVCSRCEYQDATGYCPLRLSGDCCLSHEQERVLEMIKRFRLSSDLQKERE